MAGSDRPGGPEPGKTVSVPGQRLDGRLLRRILEQATRAPSGYDLQPWRFLVIRSRRNRERLCACVHGQPIVVEAPVVVIVLGYLYPHRTHLDAILAGHVQAGLLSPGEASYRRGLVRSAMERVGDPVLWAVRSATPAVTVLVDAAARCGIGSTWIEGYDEARLRAAFGVPDDHAVCALVALGTGPPPHTVASRLALDEVCFAEHFGQPCGPDDD